MRAHNLNEREASATGSPLFDPERAIPRAQVKQWLDYATEPIVQQQVSRMELSKSEYWRRISSYPGAPKHRVAADLILMFPDSRGRLDLSEELFKVASSMINVESKGNEDFEKLRDLAVLFPGRRDDLDLDNHREVELQDLIMHPMGRPWSGYGSDNISRFSHLARNAANLRQLYPETQLIMTSECLEWFHGLITRVAAGEMTDKDRSEIIQMTADARLAFLTQLNRADYAAILTGPESGAWLKQSVGLSSPAKAAHEAWQLTMLGAAELKVDENSIVHWRSAEVSETELVLPERSSL